MLTSLQTIDCLEGYEHSINEAKRLLEKGGMLLLTTIKRASPKDKIRKNVYNKEFWVREFTSKGFKLITKDSSEMANELLEASFDGLFPQAIRRPRSPNEKVVKFAFTSLGPIARRVVWTWYKLQRKWHDRNIITLLFVKGSHVE